MHDLEGLFCKSVNSWIIAKFTELKKKHDTGQIWWVGALTMGQGPVGGEAKAGRLTWRWALTRQEEGQRERSGQSS